MTQNEKQRAYRKNNGNAVTKRYEKTKRGFIMRMYRNMKSRIFGIQSKKAHLYLGKDIMPKECFYSIAHNSTVFNDLFTKWVDSNYDRKLTPSVDRKDSSLGYTIENIRFITHSENSRLGATKKIINGKVF